MGASQHLFLVISSSFPASKVASPNTLSVVKKKNSSFLQKKYRETKIGDILGVIIHLVREEKKIKNQDN